MQIRAEENRANFVKTMVAVEKEHTIHISHAVDKYGNRQKQK